MAKPKVKLDFKELLLKKGEYLALGIAAVGLVVLLLWGVTTGAGAANPAEISKDINAKASAIGTRINDPNDPTAPDPLHESVRTDKKTPYLPIGPDQFAANGVLFDVVGKPETKRVNPDVWGIEEYQVDLVRGAMPGYDIIYVDGKEPQIAVRVEKKLSATDKEKLMIALNKLKGRSDKGVAAHNRAQNQPAPPAAPGFGPPMGPGGPMRPGGPPPGSGGGPPPGIGGPPPGFGGPPPGFGSGGGPPGYGSGFGFGGGNSGYNTGEQRTETAIAYIPLEDLDKAAGDNKLPAQTVIPLRMIVVNFTIPLKKQMEEMKKALRLQPNQVTPSLVAYDGFEVRRKITRVRPTGEVDVVQDWAKYNYEDQYVDLIDSRKLHDHFEGSDKSKQGLYLPYFYRYEDSLVMPLPELVSELGSYPPIRLKSITDAIDKLDSARTPKQDPSDVMKRLNKSQPRKSLFKPQTVQDTGADSMFGGSKFNSPDGPKGPVVPPVGKGPMVPGGGLDNQPQVDIELLLGRFIDCNVQPGLSYEYQIQLRLVNPNYEKPQWVSNPQDAKKQILPSKWIPLGQALTVPAEDFLFAADRNQYVEDVRSSYKDQPNLLKALQAKDSQAVVQAVKWMESIRMEGKHEPIGGWVVADMPVSRGEYVGKKTFVKLPLWSSEANQYVFREIAAGAVKGKDQPKGWLVDFSSKSILVDYEGGKMTTKMSSGKYIPEEAATEMLIVRADGKLLVRRSADDGADATRKELTTTWDAWLKKVESRPAASAGSGDGNPFNRKD